MPLYVSAMVSPDRVLTNFPNFPTTVAHYYNLIHDTGYMGCKDHNVVKKKLHKKKFNGVKSHDLGDQFTSSPHGIIMPTNYSYRIFNVT